MTRFERGSHPRGEDNRALLAHSSRCREFAQMQLDLTEEACALACPLTLIYGAQDPIAPPAFSRRFVHAVPQTRLIELADAGHYLCYSHWWSLLDAVA